MGKIKNHLFFRIICVVLITTFITLDISWAYPPEPASPNHNLAAQSAFQQQMMTEQAQKFQQSIFSNIALLTSVYSIGKYLLGNPEQGTEPLPLKYLESTLTAELDKTLEGIDLSKAVVKDGVIIVPYEKQGKKYVIQIALKNSVSAKDLIGYEWVVSDKYVVKAVPEGYREPAVSPLESKEKPKVTITEPIAEVTADEIKTPEDVDIPRKPSRFIIRAIITSILLIVLTPSKLFAGTEDRTNVLYSFKDFIFAHPVITAVVGLGIGVGLFFVICRVFFPVRWHSTGLTSLDSSTRKNAAEALEKLGALTTELKITRYILDLEDEDGDVRINAAEALGKIDPPAAKAAVPALIKALGDEIWSVRMTAARAIGNIDPDAIPVLIKALGDEDCSVREGAATALGNIGPTAKTAVPGLIKALGDEIWSVREAAAEALEKLGALTAELKVKRYILDLEDEDWHVHEAAAEALGQIGPAAKTAIPALIKVLEDEGIWLRPYATKALGNIGPEAKDAVPALIKALGNENPYVRKAAAEALGKIGPAAKDAVPLLIKALEGEDWHVRPYAAEALGKIAPAAKNTVPLLIKALEDEDWRVRRYAAKALGNIGSAAKDAVPALIKVLGDERPYVRTSAAEALGKIGDPRAITPLRKAGYEEISKQLEKQTQQRKPPTNNQSTLHSINPFDQVSQLFEMVETAVNNERTGFVNTGNQLVSSLAERDDLQDKVDTQKLDKGSATAEIKEQIERVIAVVDQLDRETLTEDMASQISLLKKNLDQFEAGGIVAAIIALARKAKRENQNLIIGLETDWIPGYERGKLQYNALSSLIREIESLGDTLRSLGLDNVVVVHSKRDDLAGDLLREADKTSTKLSNVVVLASNSTINSETFAPLRSAKGEERAFLAGIDPRELIKFYAENKETLDKQIAICIMEMLSLTLELALGKDAPNLPIIVTYDKALRIVIFLPKPKPLDYQELQRFYKMKKLALHSA